MTVGSRLGILNSGWSEVPFRIRRWAVVQETRKSNLLRGDSDCFLVNNVEEHFHVPLLLSPHGYSTYRGS